MDGNKRAGAGAMLIFLALNGVEDVADHDRLYDLVIATASGELRDVLDIAGRLRTLFPSLT